MDVRLGADVTDLRRGPGGTWVVRTGGGDGGAGETFDAGRMGEFTIEKDPTRDNGLRVLMGPFSIYNGDNIDAEL